MAEISPVQELARYMEHLGVGDEGNNDAASTTVEEVRTSPLFSWKIKSHVENEHSTSSEGNLPVFSQYGLMGKTITSSEGNRAKDGNSIVLLNTNAPWSAFLCGSQGSGKSYTLSCMLENCLLDDDRIGKISSPLSGLVFYYDPHPAQTICEAAYLASHARVKVLVSPSNYYAMKNLYEEKIEHGENLEVAPLLLGQEHLNTERILKLMAFSDKDGGAPLYLEAMMSILRDMALEAKGHAGFKYKTFLERLKGLKLAAGQQSPLNLRLQLLDSFLNVGMVAQRLKMTNLDSLYSEPGMLTIVDLTDPFVDTSTACVLFDICLSLFLEDSSTNGKVVALDEAHKFMNGSSAAEKFTDNLLTTIREQRHKAARVIIATQEPTISPKLLDLCSMTFVHRFTSPEWFSTLKGHLAGASPALAAKTGKTSNETSESDVQEQRDASHLFNEITELSAGESLLFAPSAMLNVDADVVRKLGKLYVKFKTRRRITADGGQSILATSRTASVSL